VKRLANSAYSARKMSAFTTMVPEDWPDTIRPISCVELLKISAMIADFADGVCKISE
jgi:hypothetical protein